MYFFLVMQIASLTLIVIMNVMSYENVFIRIFRKIKTKKNWKEKLHIAKSKY